MTATSRPHGTTAAICARNFSRRVVFFFRAYSLCAKLVCVYPDKSHLIIIIFPEDYPGMRVETSDITKNPHNTA